MELDLYPTGAILIVAVILLAFKKLPQERLMTLLGLSLLAVFALWGGLGLFFAFAPGADDGSSGFWPLLLYVGGMFWQILMNSSDLVSGGQGRRTLFMGFLLCLAGISLLELPAQYGYLEKELSLNAYNGILYLGFPYLAYNELYRQQRYTPVSKTHLLLLFALGMLIGIPALAGVPLAWVPLFWAIALFATVWHAGRWDDRLDGPVYGVALGLGFAVYYTHPVLIPVPAFAAFAARLTDVQLSYVGAPIWPWELRWWAILAGSGVAAGVLGLFLGVARSRTRWLRAAYGLLGLVLSAGLLAVVAPIP